MSFGQYCPEMHLETQSKFYNGAFVQRYNYNDF